MGSVDSNLLINFEEHYKNKQRINNLDLPAVDFSGQNLSQLHAENSDFHASNFSRTDLSKSRFTQCNLQKAVIAGANLTDSVIRLCDFNGADARSVAMTGAIFEDNQVESADFTEVKLTRAKLTDTNWSRSTLRSANLDGAVGDGVCFRGADLTNASLAGARLVDADFRGADLSNANLAGSDLSGADFRGAILENVLWEGAQISGALFDKEFQANAAQNAPSDNDSPGDTEVSDEELARAVKKVISGIFSQAAQYFKHDDDLKEMLGKISQWQRQKGKMDAQTMRDLIGQLEKSVAVGATIPPEIISPLKSILEVVSDTNAGEPTDEIKNLLRKFFPEINDSDMIAFDQIFSKYSSFFESQKDRH